MNPPRDRYDLYAALGVPKHATAAQIDAAFRTLARRLHPDVRPNDPASAEKFKLAARAHSVLADPRQRREYDQLHGIARGAASGATRGTTGTRSGSGKTSGNGAGARRPTAPPRQSYSHSGISRSTVRPEPARPTPVVRGPSFIDHLGDRPLWQVLAFVAFGFVFGIVIIAVGSIIFGASAKAPTAGVASTSPPPTRTLACPGSGTQWLAESAQVIAPDEVTYQVGPRNEQVIVPGASAAARADGSLGVYVSTQDDLLASIDPCGGGQPPR
jgi:hypothetical protein